jgi:hypothetical protein
VERGFAASDIISRIEQADPGVHLSAKLTDIESGREYGVHSSLRYDACPNLTVLPLNQTTRSSAGANRSNGSASGQGTP